MMIGNMKADMRISNYQLFSLIAMHSLGTLPIFAIGIRAKQDAWIVALLGLLLGFGMIWIHTELQQNYPRKSLAEINTTLFGKILGGVLTILYAFFFIWDATLDLTTTTRLISLTTLPLTPMLVIQGVFMLVIIYITWKNIEVLGRTSEVLMPIVMFSLIILLILIFLSGLVNLKALQPILANGIMPVLNESYPTFSVFPYGGNVAFLMFYCYVNKSKDIRKYAFSAIFMVGTILVFSTIMSISVLGVEIDSAATMPFIEVVKMVNVGDIITNIDALAVLIIFVGGLFKTMLFFYASVLALSTLFKIRREILIIVTAVFMVWFSLTYFRNFVFHQLVGIAFTNSYIQEIYMVYIPLLILVITWLKNLIKKAG